jgi:hypothetical protein
VSPSGVGLLAWYEEDTQGSGLALTSHRDGQWTSAVELNNRHDFGGSVEAGDDGVMHYIGPDSDVTAWTSTLDGEWPKTGVVLSPRRALGDVRLAVAASGDAVAAWRDEPSSPSDSST